MIELKNISKHYLIHNRRVEALRDVSLHVPRGEIYGVVGQSGAGKSTLIRCVNLLERPSAGEIWVNGVQMERLSASELNLQRRKIGMIFQHFNLLANRTVYENVALSMELTGAAPQTIKHKVEALLDLIHLGDKALHYPAQLSGGQKQRVAIARALANEPDILLSDEATSALDPKTTEDILNLLQDINRQLGLTILLITHEMEVVKQICHRVALLEHGQLVESASVEQFFTQPQSDLGKRFVAQVQHFDLPEPYQKRLLTQGAHPVIALRFQGQNVDQPLLSLLSKRFGVDVNIIQAKIEYVGQSTFGLLHAELMGERAAEALQYVQQSPIECQVLGYLEETA